MFASAGYPKPNENLRNLSIDFEENRDYFASIPPTENILILGGEFDSSTYFSDYSHRDLIRALEYLPKHISKISLQLKCHYSYYTYSTRNYHSDCESYDTHYVYTKAIGDYFKEYISSLPKSIDTVEIAGLKHDETERCRENVQKIRTEFLGYLPASVKYLVFGTFFFWDDAPELFLNALNKIAETVQSVKIAFKYKKKKDWQDNISHCFPTIPLSLYNLSELIMSNCDLCDLANPHFKTMLTNISKNMKRLDLGYNQLHKKNPHEMALVLTTIQAELEILRLQGNNLAIWGSKIAGKFLSQLQNITGLDIGENGFLSLKMEEFAFIMESLAPKITWLRICEIKSTQPLNEMAKRLHYLGPNIKILSFSNGGLTGISLKDFVDIVLANITASIEGFDLSGNNLGNRPIDELIYFFSHTPSRFRFLDLSDNGLAWIKEEDSKALWPALSPWVEELDVSRNGFDKLPFLRMRNILSLFPASLKSLITGSEEFSLQNDGTMVPRTQLSATGFFRPQKRFYHQREFAPLRIIMIQLMTAKGINLDIVLHILSYILNGHPALMIMRGMISSGMISSVPPWQITLADQYNCLDVVERRIQMLKSNDICLDLSRCGLNRITDPEILKRIEYQIENLSAPVSHLNMRGNGFLYDENTIKVFIRLMKLVSDKIQYLDLSDNGFENESAEELEKLFSYVSPTVELIRIDNEEPMSPALHIAIRKWPERYFVITEFARDDLDRARALLNDYTKYGSAFWRFIYGQWNRHHLKKVEKLVYFIDHKRITCMEDLKYEARQFQLANQTGSLALTFSFLAQPRKDMPNVALICEGNKNDDNDFENKPSERRITGGHS